MIMGGINLSSASESPFHERPGTYSRPKRPAISSKKSATLVAAFAQGELKSGLILGGLGDFGRSLANDRADAVRGFGVLEAVEIILAGAPVGNQAGRLQLRELGRYGALTQCQDLLQFGDGELFHGSEVKGREADSGRRVIAAISILKVCWLTASASAR